MSTNAISITINAWHIWVIAKLILGSVITCIEARQPLTKQRLLFVFFKNIIVNPEWAFLKSLLLLPSYIFARKYVNSFLPWKTYREPLACKICKDTGVRKQKSFIKGEKKKLVPCVCKKSADYANQDKTILCKKCNTNLATRHNSLGSLCEECYVSYLDLTKASQFVPPEQYNLSRPKLCEQCREHESDVFETSKNLCHPCLIKAYMADLNSMNGFANNLPTITKIVKYLNEQGLDVAIDISENKNLVAKFTKDFTTGYRLGNLTPHFSIQRIIYFKDGTHVAMNMKCDICQKTGVEKIILGKKSNWCLDCELSKDHDIDFLKRCVSNESSWKYNRFHFEQIIKRLNKQDLEVLVTVENDEIRKVDIETSLYESYIFPDETKLDCNVQCFAYFADDTATIMHFKSTS